MPPHLPSDFGSDARYWGTAPGTPDHEPLVDMYNFYSLRVDDLAYELTRAANLICDIVRLSLDRNYRSQEGVVTLTWGHSSPRSIDRDRRDPRYGSRSGLVLGRYLTVSGDCSAPRPQARSGRVAVMLVLVSGIRRLKAKPKSKPA